MNALTQEQGIFLRDVAELLLEVPAAKRGDLRSQVARLLAHADLSAGDHAYLFRNRPTAFLPGNLARGSKRFDARLYHFELVEDENDPVIAAGFATRRELMRLFDRSDRMVDNYLKSPRHQRDDVAALPFSRGWASRAGIIFVNKLFEEPEGIDDTDTLELALLRFAAANRSASGAVKRY